MELFSGETPEEAIDRDLRGATPENGKFLRVNFVRIFEMPQEALDEGLAQVKLGYDCPCLEGENCEARCDDEFMRIRMAAEAHRASTYEFPDNDAQASYEAMIEDLAEGCNNDSKTLAALAMHAIRRLNEYERAFRLLKNSE